jgi:hypothetical protein
MFPHPVMNILLTVLSTVVVMSFECGMLCVMGSSWPLPVRLFKLDSKQ